MRAVILPPPDPPASASTGKRKTTRTIDRMSFQVSMAPTGFHPAALAGSLVKRRTRFARPNSIAEP